MFNKGKGFIPRIESLRGMAALLVGFYHCGCLFLPFPPSGLSLSTRSYFGFGNGMGCVVVFFVISGFVLARSLDRNAYPSLYDFFRDRAFRLLPASIAVVGILALLHQQFGFYVGYEGRFDPLNIALNMLLLKSDINGVMWSLTVELAATPLIFAAVIAYRRLGPAPLVSIVVILFGLSFVGQYRDMIGANLAPLYAFVVGVLVHFEAQRLTARLPSRFAILIAVAGLFLFFIAGMMKHGAGLMILMDSMAGAALVLTIARWPQLRTLKPLDWPVVQFFGRVSYSFYLLNPLTVYPASYLLSEPLRQLPPIAQALALTIVTTLLTSLPAYLCHTVIETPGIAFGRRVGAARFSTVK
jgi:peptidoglycan/LPS O-acetylase OafA/YrhL